MWWQAFFQLNRVFFYQKNVIFVNIGFWCLCFSNSPSGFLFLLLFKSFDICYFKSTRKSLDLLFVIFIYAFLCTENKKVIKEFKLQSIFLPFYTQLWKLIRQQRCQTTIVNVTDMMQCKSISAGTPCTPGLTVLVIPLLSSQRVCPLVHHLIFTQSFLPLHWCGHDLLMLKSGWPEKYLVFGISSLVRITR